MQRILRDTFVKVSYLKKTTIVITVPSKAMSNALLPPCYLAAFSVLYIQSTHHEKIPAMNFIYAHAQDFAMSDELLLATLK
jgi:hypothetical protein